MAGQEIATESADRASTPREPIAARSAYSFAAIGLHWVTAIAFVMQLGLGWRMGEAGAPDRFAVFQLHKSIGISILVLTVGRLALRMSTPWPALSMSLNRAERVTARVVHAGFYGLLIALPVSGWLTVSSSPRHIPTYLFGVVRWPNFPGIDALTPALKSALNGISAGSHEVMAYLALGAIALHVAGALKHQFLDDDQELARMIQVRRSMAGAIAIVVLVVAVGLGGLAATGRLSSIAARLVHRDDRAPAPPLPARPALSAAPTPVQSSSSALDASAIASEAAPTPTATANAEAAQWHVRRAVSTLGFQTHWSQGPVEGHFARWAAQIRFAPDALATSRVNVMVDLASVATNSPDTQDALPGSDWFAASLHPTATFVADTFTHLSGDRYTAHGTLQLHGISRPLSLPFTLRIKGQVASMSAVVAIDRTAYGIGQGEWQSTADVPAKVLIAIALTADRTNPQGDPK